MAPTFARCTRLVASYTRAPIEPKNMNILLSYMNLEVQETYYLAGLTREEFTTVSALHGYLMGADLPESLFSSMAYLSARVYPGNQPVTKLGYDEKNTKCTITGAWAECKITENHTPTMRDYTFVDTGIVS